MNRAKMNKKVIVIVVALIILIGLVGGGYLFISGRSKSNTSDNTPAPTEMVVPTIDPSEIGLTLTLSPDHKIVNMQITKLEGISAIDYELTYFAMVKGEKVSRGTIGHVDVTPSDSVINKEIKLGTCSDVCHYDEGVTNIKITLKITKSDGNIFQAEQSVE
ncbi:MAG: hypothetical protein M1268_00660 [Patescibacteria group bacterium]|nr:hypothetical protein [Patescibacteria group bacterium]